MPENTSQPFETFTSLSARMVLDSTSLYWEHLRVRMAFHQSGGDHLALRLESLTAVLDEMELVLKALKIGSVSEPLVELLDSWALASEERIVLGAPALHVYSTLAGVRLKPAASSNFNSDENQELEDWLKKATVTKVLRPNVTDQVVFSRSGRPGLMRVLGPLSFVKFHQWLCGQPGRSALQIRQAQQQIEVIERLISAGHLSATHDQY